MIVKRLLPLKFILTLIFLFTSRDENVLNHGASLIIMGRERFKTVPYSVIAVNHNYSMYMIRHNDKCI